MAVVSKRPPGLAGSEFYGELGRKATMRRKADAQSRRIRPTTAAELLVRAFRQVSEPSGRSDGCSAGSATDRVWP